MIILHMRSVGFLSTCTSAEAGAEVWRPVYFLG